MSPSMNNLISVSASLVLVAVLLLGYYLRTRRVQGRIAALWEAQLKAMDRQSAALERIVAALEGSQLAPVGFVPNQVYLDA
jgi:hypothetical protein